MPSGKELQTNATRHHFRLSGDLSPLHLATGGVLIRYLLGLFLAVVFIVSAGLAGAQDRENRKAPPQYHTAGSAWRFSEVIR